MTTTRTFQRRGLNYPDMATAAVVYLKTVIDPQVRVSVDLTGWRRPQPSVQIHQRSGQNVGIAEDSRLQVDVRAETMDEAYALADEVRARLMDFPFSNPAVIAASEYTGVQPLPDDDMKPRIMFVFDVRARGARAT